MSDDSKWFRKLCQEYKTGDKDTREFIETSFPSMITMIHKGVAVLEQEKEETKKIVFKAVLELKLKRAREMVREVEKALENDDSDLNTRLYALASEQVTDLEQLINEI